MAHVQKNTRVATGHLFDHYGRNAEDEKYKYLYRSNDFIDPNKTYLNYNLAPNEESQEERLNKRLSEVKVLKRKDVNIMCSWVVTAPKDLDPKQEKDFFKTTYEFLKNRYGGEKNVISAYVHKDETTPHLHFAFVPVTLDKKKNIEKVSAKEVITKLDLKSFHEDLQKYLEKVNIKCSILNGATREGNKSIEELKRKSAAERLQETALEASKIVFKAQEEVNILKQQEKALQGQINGLQRDILTAQQVKDIPHTKALIGNKQVVATADFEALCKTAATAEELLEEIKPARKIYTQAQEILQNAQIEANNIVKQAQDKARSLAEHMDSIKYLRKLQHIEKVINSSPQLIKDYQQAEKALLARQKTNTYQRNFNKER